MYQNSINGSIITRLLLLPSHEIYTCLCRSKQTLWSLTGINAWRLHAILQEIFHAIFNSVKHCIPVILEFFQLFDHKERFLFLIPQHFSWSIVFIWKLKLTMIKRLLNIFTFLALLKQWGSCVCVRGYLFEDTEMKYKTVFTKNCTHQRKEIIWPIVKYSNSES